MWVPKKIWVDFAPIWTADSNSTTKLCRMMVSDLNIWLAPGTAGHVQQFDQTWTVVDSPRLGRDMNLPDFVPYVHSSRLGRDVKLLELGRNVNLLMTRAGCEFTWTRAGCKFTHTLQGRKFIQRGRYVNLPELCQDVNLPRLGRRVTSTNEICWTDKIIINVRLFHAQLPDEHLGAHKT